MLFKILNRVLVNVVTLFLIILFSYGLMKVVPGNPFEGERNVSPEALAALEEKYNFTAWEYLSGIILKGDFRYSYQKRDKTVREIIVNALPVSLELGFWAILIAITLGMMWGTLAAIYRKKYIEGIVMSIAMIGIIIPNFVLGPLLQLFFSLHLGWTPVAMWKGFSYKILPVITLSLMYVAYIARITRGSILDSLTKTYVKTAKAKGLNSFQIMFRHILRNSLIPIINYLGPATAALLTGSLVVEKVFQLPGIGREFVESALQRDYPLALGVLIVYSALLLTINLITDILQTLIDPRIQL